jgi:tetratricopeptide (TPR) repeat protein
MRDQHPEPEVLAEYAVDPASIPNREEIEAHLERCAACGEIVAGARDFERELANPETWRAADALAGLLATPSPRLVAAEEQLRTEDAAAAAMLDAILHDAERFTGSRIADDPRCRTAGVVRRLNRASVEVRERNATFALALADAAVQVAERLPESGYGGEQIAALRGQAWRERANALRYTGDYPAALDAVDEAARAFQATTSPEFDLARVDFVRGTILWKMERFDEALPLARRARRIFREYDDAERWLHAGLLEGSILFDSQQYVDALTVYERLRGPAETLNDGPTLARVYNNIAAVNAEVGHLDRAAEYFRLTIALYDLLGMTLETARTHWSLALLALRAGRAADGITRLRKVIATFESCGSTADAGLVALDLAEHLLAWGDVAEVAALCEELIARFTAAGLTRSAAAAFAFLRDATHRTAVTPAALSYLRVYFRRLTRDPQLHFAEPDLP